MHKGNIYLQVINTADGLRIWHLDAIQIRPLGLNWKDFIANMTTSLSGIGGYDLITVNSLPGLISNYDYISKATREYLGKGIKDSGSDRNMSLPSYPSHRGSTLQGNGDYFILADLRKQKPNSM